MALKSKFVSKQVQSGPKVSHYQIIKTRIKSYQSVPMKLDSFVKLKYRSSSIIFSVGIKYPVCDLLCDAANYV